MKQLLFFSFGLIFLFSCKKEADKTCNRDLAGISGTYKVTSASYKATPAAAEVDYYSILYSDACEKDDVFVFNANGSFAYNDAGIACSPSGSYTGIWSLSGNTMTVDGDPGNIDDFNCSSLTISGADIKVAGDKIIIVFSRQ
jgi:hypothetical protein